ncbi:MAG: DUF4250 domain-containing protein [Succinivibrionaceae bacterium]
MNLSNYKTMDPYILFSIVNMKLRDENYNLDELCSRYDIEKNILNERLSSIGYQYNPKTNQFV